MRHLYFLVIMLFLSLITSAQNIAECLDKYNKAVQLFNGANYFSCADNIEKALLICEFSGSEKEKMLILLTESYIELDNVKSAENTLKKLFKNNPVFTPNPSEVSEDFMILQKKFRKHPLITVGIRYSYGKPYLKITKTYSVLEGVDYHIPYSTGGNSQKFFVWGEYEFHKNISVTAEFTLFTLTYDRTFQQTFENRSSFSLNYTEDIRFAEVPVLLKMYFPIKSNLLPYVSAGIGWLRTINAESAASITIDEPVSYTDPFTGSDANINVIKMRTPDCFEWIAGAGIGYKLKNWKFTIDIRYCGGLNSIMDKNHRNSNDLLLNKYYYIDSAVKLNMVEAGVSVSYVIKNSVTRTK